MENKTNHKAAGLRRGIYVLAALAALTLIEYFVGVVEAPAVFMVLIALLKAAAVLWYFMHVGKLFRSEEGH